MYKSNSCLMCYEFEECIDREDILFDGRNDLDGDRRSVIRYSDGSSKVYWGDGCGESCYDYLGMER